MTPSLNFSTSWGKQFTFAAHDKASVWPLAGGVYMFVRPPAGLLSSSQWRVFYAGMTENLLRRLVDHERWEEAARRGATHVAICVVLNPLERAQLELEIIKFADPPLNVQLRRGGGLAGFAV